MNKGVVEDIINKKKIKLREGIPELLDLIVKHDVPLLIFSAGVGNIIEELLKLERKMTKNIHIISNTFVYDKEGKVIDYETDIIHTFNKNEGQIKKTPYYKQIADRKNVILLGDSIGDLGMLEGLDHKEVIKIGFLNENVEDNLRLFSRKFDFIILRDGSAEPVIDLFKKLI
jgi:5'-nucleotidase